MPCENVLNLTSKVLVLICLPYSPISVNLPRKTYKTNINKDTIFICCLNLYYKNLFNIF